ncbi:MAG: GNAT family N-acetyltransferase [Alphaproteobacteria bacterium]|nr:GNAT family N-acetyltransferase [Alphaproteobacteria bacterium]
MTAGPITLDTPNYVLRTLSERDVSEMWTHWLADAETARLLNAKPRAFSLDELRAYVASFDSKTRFLFGIFDKQTSALVGLRSIYVDTGRREFLDNVLIGPLEARGKQARHESSSAVWRYFFETRDLVRARGTILAENKHMLAVATRRGWVHERTSHVPSATGAGLVEVHHVVLDRDTWRRLHGDAV